MNDPVTRLVIDGERYSPADVGTVDHHIADAEAGGATRYRAGRGPARHPSTR